jgi:PAS domain-containing protein
VRLPATPSDRWQPWTEMRSSLPARGPASLHRAVAALAEREPQTEPAKGQPNVLHGVTAGQGAVAAFQVARSTWLLVLFPRTSPSLPLVPVSLSVGVLALLLVGLERNRRRAERAQRKAEGELQEKQNLLNTMQVPLVVVDPNTDEVVSSNRAAEDLGIRPGSRIADLVLPEPRAQAHYERMQVAGPETRRAYGLPVRVRGEGGGEETRYAVVRSVAVTAPIEALQADERHRLGILFLLDFEADLALLTEELTGATRGDERRRLAGLPTHGVDLPARVLAHFLGKALGRAAAPPELTAWLAVYLDARLRTISWLLDHWDARPPLPPDSSVEVSQARATLDRLQGVFLLAARDVDLRCRLHWDNGVLAADPGSDRAVLAVEIDWPESHWFPCPVRGGFGFFLSEVLINAMRHGRPGSVPTVRIALDRVRRELVFEVENEVRPEARGAHSGAFEPAAGLYGGTGILRQLARLFDWEGPWFEPIGDRFRVTWKVPASERGDPRRAD